MIANGFIDIRYMAHLDSHGGVNCSDNSSNYLHCDVVLIRCYNGDATSDDGSCTYDVSGCTDPSASNYNADATSDDGSCEPVQAEGCSSFLLRIR